uniref:RxLR effector protein n=1 Tax=Phytophthora agathidicida TaxID=1642459 RepID=A0A7G4WI48_9STRA|nr:PaRXLR59 [Phytophthora agathidicida]
MRPSFFLLAATAAALFGRCIGDPKREENPLLAVDSTDEVQRALTDGKRFLRSFSDIDDDGGDEERGLGFLLNIFRGHSNDFENPAMKKGFDRIMGLFGQWGDLKGAALARTARNAVDNDAEAQALLEMHKMFKKMGSDQLYATLVKAARERHAHHA